MNRLMLLLLVLVLALALRVGPTFGLRLLTRA